MKRVILPLIFFFSPLFFVCVQSICFPAFSTMGTQIAAAVRATGARHVYLGTDAASEQLRQAIASALPEG